LDILLIGLLALAMPVCALAALVIAVRTRSRLRAVEERLRLIEGNLPSSGPLQAPAAPAPEPETASAATPPESASKANPPPTPPEPFAAPAPPVGAAPVPQPGLEERIGTRWAVWTGGVALALGGLFLVRYSIEQGFLGPAARVAAGALFAFILIGLGEIMRRRERRLSLPGIPSAHVPSVLTAAGTITAFATAYASYGLYGLIGPAAAFILLGAISVLVMLSATLHGPALAGLGLAASFVSPLLVSSDRPQLWPVVVYLAFAVASAYAVARLRLWRWLALTAAGGAALWGLIFVFSAGPEILAAMAHVLIQTVLAGVFLVADPHRRTEDPDAEPDVLASGVLLALAALAILAASSIHAGAARPPFAAAAALTMLGLSIRYAPAAAGAAWAAFMGFGTVAMWPLALQVAVEPATVLPGPSGEPAPASLTTYLTFALALALTVATASLWRVERGRDLPRRLAAWYAGAATAGPLAILIAVYWRVTEFDRSMSFALVAGALACSFAAVTVRLRRQENERINGLHLTVGATASAAIAALALGLTFALEKGMLTVAVALTALGTAWVADRASLPALRYVVGALGCIVLSRLIWHPTIVDDPGSTLIFNWLLWGYGIPAVAFYLASRLLERGGRDRITQFTESLAITFAAFLAFFEIRHSIHGGDVHAASSSHLEAGLMATASLLFAFVTVRMDSSRPDSVYRIGSFVFGAVSLIVSGFGLLLSENPLLTGEPVVGGAVLNSLLPAYLLPALCAAMLAAAARDIRPRPYVLAAAGLALVLHLAYTVLEIRRLFQGSVVHHFVETGQGEQWSYSLALLGIGLVLLVFGLAKDVRLARLASAAYIVLAVLKVFIIDLANLEGVMRALSFIGLGLVLVGIGLAYQRLLTRRPPAALPSA